MLVWRLVIGISLKFGAWILEFSDKLRLGFCADQPGLSDICSHQPGYRIRFSANILEPVGEYPYIYICLRVLDF